MKSKYLRKYIDIFSKCNRYSAICKLFIVSILSVGYAFNANSQQKVFQNYVKKYKDVAIKHQKKYGIPASITLAQGLLESQAGQSYLAVNGNNHFGIKHTSDWNGKKIRHKDKSKGWFRKYDKAEDSFKDHALFLKRKRYEPLFKLKTTDYKGWAKTLRKCGYATDPKYPQKLIGIIERYELHRFDKDNGKGNDDDIYFEEEATIAAESTPHTVIKKGNLKYVKARYGDTYESISKEFDIKKKKLLEYNDLKKDRQLEADDFVYLQEKGKKSAETAKYYTVRRGETLYSISQKLGIQLKHLLKKNDLDKDDKIKPGETLKVK